MVEARNVGHDGLLIRSSCTNDICGGGRHETEHVNYIERQRESERKRESFVQSSEIKAHYNLDMHFLKETQQATETSVINNYN